MNWLEEQWVREIAREAIARHQREGDSKPASRPVGTHASFALFALPVGGDIGGACLIEPTVPCNHCGYCRTLGH
jgi:hypothetical protein